jgi:hypothetical protein
MKKSALLIRIALIATSFNLMFLVTLAGVKHKGPDILRGQAMLRVNTENLQSIGDIFSRSLSQFSEHTDSVSSASSITAANLRIADSYKVYLWNYCATTGSETVCSRPKYDWAASELDALTGLNVDLPKEVRIFIALSRITGPAYIIATIFLGFQLTFHFFELFSLEESGVISYFILFRYLEWLAAICSVAASVLGTTQTCIVVAAIGSVTKVYGPRASLNWHFLAFTWLAVLFFIINMLYNLPHNLLSRIFKTPRRICCCF